MGFPGVVCVRVGGERFFFSPVIDFDAHFLFVAYTKRFPSPLSATTCTVLAHYFHRVSRHRCVVRQADNDLGDPFHSITNERTDSD